jgi:hypothetical protein
LGVRPPSPSTPNASSSAGSPHRSALDSSISLAQFEGSRLSSGKARPGAAGAWAAAHTSS